MQSFVKISCITLISFSNLQLWKQNGHGNRKSTVYSCGSGYMGIVSGRWKLQCCENGGDMPEALKSAFTKQTIEQQFELYDLASDIEETNNVNEAKAWNGYTLYPSAYGATLVDMSGRIVKIWKGGG